MFYFFLFSFFCKHSYVKSNRAHATSSDSVPGCFSFFIFYFFYFMKLKILEKMKKNKKKKPKMRPEYVWGLNQVGQGQICQKNIWDLMSYIQSCHID